MNLRTLLSAIVWTLTATSVQANMKPSMSARLEVDAFSKLATLAPYLNHAEKVAVSHALTTSLQDEEKLRQLNGELDEMLAMAKQPGHETTSVCNT